MDSRFFIVSLCALLSVPILSGMDFEYKPPPAKSPTDLFTALLDPAEGSNVSVAYFMYHFKHGTYASGFLAEFFTLGIHTHLFTDEEIAYPADRERRIAIAVGRIWATLKNIRAVNRIAEQICNATSHRYMQRADKTDVLQYAFTRLEDSILAEPTLSKAYAAEKERTDAESLPPLLFVNINLTKFGKIERTLKKSVWTDPKSHLLVARERFSQHVESKLEDTNPDDHDNVVLAHELVDLATDPELGESAEKAYDQGVKEAVKNSFEMLTDMYKIENYTEFDHVLFNSLNGAIKTYPKLNLKLMETKRVLLLG